MTNKDVEPLLPVELGAGKVKLAQGIKAGRWDFDGRHGAGSSRTASHRRAAAAPHTPACRSAKRRPWIWENIDAVSRVAHRPNGNLVRTDQYHATVQARRPSAQRRVFPAGRAAITLITQQGLLAGRRHEHPGGRHRAHPDRSRPSEEPAPPAADPPGLFCCVDRWRLHPSSGVTAQR